MNCFLCTGLKKREGLELFMERQLLVPQIHVSVLIAQICCLWPQALAAKNENCSQYPFKSLLGWEVADTLCPDLSWSTGSQPVGRCDPFKASPKHRLRPSENTDVYITIRNSGEISYKVAIM